jgi:hypothetical protein
VASARVPDGEALAVAGTVEGKVQVADGDGVQVEGGGAGGGAGGRLHEVDGSHGIPFAVKADVWVPAKPGEGRRQSFQV